MTTPTKKSGRVAVWYRRPSGNSVPEPLEQEREAAQAIADRLSVAIACEVEAVGSAKSPTATTAWASAKREAEVLGATHLIVLRPTEIAWDLAAYYTEVEALRARGIQVVHHDGTRDWAGELNGLLQTFAAVMQATPSDGSAELGVEVWRSAPSNAEEAA